MFLSAVRGRRVVGVAAGIAAVALLVGGGTGVYAEQVAKADAGSFQAALAGARLELRQAYAEGYSQQDLQPVEAQLASLSARPAPAVPWQLPSFYAAQLSALAGVRHQLTAQQEQIRTSTLAELRDLSASISTALEQDREAGVPTSALTAFQQSLAQLVAPSADTIGHLRQLVAAARTLAGNVAAAGQEQQQQNLAIQQAAASLLTLARSNPKAALAEGHSALADGRNDATVAAYENFGGRFPEMAAMTDAYGQLERYGAELDTADPASLADAVAGVEHYAAAIHQLLLQNLGPQHIIVSFQAQHVWVYQGSRVVMDSAVTTGIRGITDYGTDFGPMKVLWKSHPFTFKSPYPRSSPYWYPNTEVQWTVFFTNSGESFHDAYWEADSELGPGSQYNLSTRSHGCIHLPFALAEWLFGWANVGTPVDVVPGDGQTVQAQLAEITTDAHGNPINPA